MNNYRISYELNYFLTGGRSERLTTVQPIPANSKYDAVAMLAQRIGENDRVNIDIFSVEEIQ